MSRTSEYRRFQEWVHNHRLEKLVHDSPMTVWWNSHSNPRYLKRYYYGNAFRKRASKRKVRRIKADEPLPKGNLYQKYYDYWWNIT